MNKTTKQARAQAEAETLHMPTVDLIRHADTMIAAYEATVTKRHEEEMKMKRVLELLMPGQ